MTETRDLLERGVGGIDARPDALERMLLEVHRRQRRQRLRAGAMGLALTVGVGAGLFWMLPGSNGEPAEGLEGAACPDDTVEIYVPSESMLPTLRVGDHVLVDVHAYDDGRTPGRGDIVYWRIDPGEFLKRVIALPGETIEFRGGITHIDGEPIDEPYLGELEDRRSFPPELVKEGHLFVLGDNRLNSNDSRFLLGQVPIDSILGQACAVVAPSDRGSVVIPEAPAVTGGGS